MMETQDIVTEKERQEAYAEREFWQKLGEDCHLGTLIGWTYKSSAIFHRKDGSIDVSGPLLKVFLELQHKLNS